MAIDYERDALSLFNKAGRIPQGVTRARVLTDENIAIDGTLYVPESKASALFLHAFDTRHYVCKVIKIPSDPSDAAREVEFYETNKDEIETLHVALVPVKYIKLSGSHLKEPSPVKQVTAGILMPKYELDLHSLPIPVHPSLCRHIFTDLLIAVQYIHSKGWMHGDIKPQNIFLDASGVPRIGDYGSSVSIMNLGAFRGGTFKYQCVEVSYMHTPERFDCVGLILSMLYLHGVQLPIESIASIQSVVNNCDIDEDLKELYLRAID